MIHYFLRVLNYFWDFFFASTSLFLPEDVNGSFSDNNQNYDCKHYQDVPDSKEWHIISRICVLVILNPHNVT